jgi:hypothetical protein
MSWTGTLWIGVGSRTTYGGCGNESSRRRRIWFQAGGGKVTETKTVRTKPGQSVRVGFTKPVGQDEIDLIEALDGDDCKVRAAMVDTFGAPQG